MQKNLNVTTKINFLEYFTYNLDRLLIPAPLPYFFGFMLCVVVHEKLTPGDELFRSIVIFGTG